MLNIKYDISDFRRAKFDPFQDYPDSEWWKVQLLIEDAARQRELEEKKARRDFKLACMFLGSLGLLCLTLFIGVATISYTTVSNYQKGNLIK